MRSAGSNPPARTKNQNRSAERRIDCNPAWWYDEAVLEVGYSLRKKIDEGLASSTYGIVVLSHQFFAKDWPQKELDGLVSEEISGSKVILPVWHNLTLDEVRSYSPVLSGIVAANSNEGMPQVLKKLCDTMGL
jgi:hypothetical protein